jgi:hypothetical protein
MSRAISFAMVLLFVSSLSAPVKSAPPAGGFPSVRERIETGCRDVDLILVVKVLNVKQRNQSGGVLSTGDIKVEHVLKGEATRAPKFISSFKPVPLMTEVFPLNLLEGMDYLWIVKNSTMPSWQEVIPLDETLENGTKETIAFAQKACHRHD